MEFYQKINKTHTAIHVVSVLEHIVVLYAITVSLIKRMGEITDISEPKLPINKKLLCKNFWNAIPSGLLYEGG